MPFDNLGGGRVLHRNLPPHLYTSFYFIIGQMESILVQNVLSYNVHKIESCFVTTGQLLKDLLLAKLRSCLG